MKKILTKEKFNALIEQIGLGKRRALKLFYDLYGKFIYFAAFSVCKSTLIADEVVNDVLLKIWQLSSTSKLEVDNPEGWLYKVAINDAKKRIERKAVPLTENIIDSKDDIGKMLDENSFYNYIDDLSEEEQIILIARFIQDLKFDDIAVLLDMPLSTLTAKYYRALAKIRKKIEK